MEHLLLVITFALIEVGGVILLAQEVNIGREMERLQTELQFARQLQYLYTVGDVRGFYIACRLNEGDTPERANNYVNLLTNESMKSAMDNLWDPNNLARALKRWDKFTTPAGERKRLIKLTMGVSCLVIAITGHLILELVS